MEERKEIPGYEGKYLVSSHGRVLSKWRMNRGTVIKKDIILCTSNSGIPPYCYKVIGLCLNGIQKKTKVHRLVAQAFLGLDIKFTDHKKSMCVCHKDDDPTNNHVDNLFLGTNKENNNDMMNKGRRIFRRGKEHPGFGKESKTKGKFGNQLKKSKAIIKLTKDNIYISQYGSICEASRITGISRPNISSCCLGKAITAGGYKRDYL